MRKIWMVNDLNYCIKIFFSSFGLPWYHFLNLPESLFLATPAGWLAWLPPATPSIPIQTGHWCPLQALAFALWGSDSFSCEHYSSALLSSGGIFSILHLSPLLNLERVREEWQSVATSAWSAKLIKLPCICFVKMLWISEFIAKNWNVKPLG